MAEETIAIIDGDTERAKWIATHLQSEGFATVHAECVLTGLHTVTSSTPQAILIAHHLKLLHARDFLWLKQQVGELVDIPTVVYALSKGESYNIFKDGCDDALTEPIDLSELSMRLKVALRRSSSHGVVGSFAHIAMLDLLQMIVASRLTGRFDVDAAGNRGSLHFQRGQLVRAWSEEAEGEDAFMLLIRSGRKGGKFVYSSSNSFSAERNVHKATDHLLLEIANSLDEGDG